METAPHGLKKRLAALVQSLLLLVTCLPGALAVDLNVDAGSVSYTHLTLPTTSRV